METFSSLGLDDIERLQKRGIRFDESYGASVCVNEDKPLEGVTLKQRNRNKNAGDVLNIGTGTRCKSCGMLYFCWVDKCRTCGVKMDFNLSTKE